MEQSERRQGKKWPPRRKGSFSQWIGGIGIEALKGDLDQASEKYHAGDYAEAEADLLELMAGLDQLNRMASLDQKVRPDAELAAPALLQAEVSTLLGRVQDRRGQRRKARATLRDAVAVFERWLPHASGRTYCAIGVAQHLLGRRKEAIAAFRRADALGSATAETCAYLGMDLLKESVYDEAETSLKRAIDMGSDEPGVLEALAEALGGQGRFEEAGTTYLEAAFVLASSNHLDEALIAVSHVRTLSPQDPRALAIEGEVLRLLGRDSEALKALDQALTLAPGYPGVAGVAESRSEILRALGRPEDALQALEQALTVAPDYPEALASKGDTLRELGRGEEALQTLEQALALNPDSAEALASKGETLRELGRDEEALQALDQARKLNPTLDWTHVELGETLRVLGRPEDALQALEQALTVAPDYPEALASKGETLRALGRHKEALEALDQALALRPDFARALGSKGAELGDLERYPEALQALERALQLEPDDVFAVESMASLLCHTGEYETAARVLEEAMKRNPPAATVLELKGWALQNLGPARAQEARKAYEAALALEPKNLWARKGLANALRNTGEPRAARVQYRRVIEEGTPPGDAETLSLVGWCHYCIADYETAVRYYIDALILDSDNIPTQFDLALALIGGKKKHLALREYERGEAQVEGKPVERRRGLLSVAVKDLSEAMQANGPATGGEAQNALRLLKTSLKASRKGQRDAKTARRRNR